MEKILSYNHKARYKYKIYHVIECGLILKSTDIKPIKKKYVNISNSYITFKKKELFIVKLQVFYIFEKFSISTHNNVSKTRKILANKKEILHLYKEYNKKSAILIPTKIIEKRGWIKLIIGCAFINKNIIKLSDRKESNVDILSLSTYDKI